MSFPGGTQEENLDQGLLASNREWPLQSEEGRNQFLCPPHSVCPKGIKRREKPTLSLALKGRKKNGNSSKFRFRKKRGEYILCGQLRVGLPRSLPLKLFPRKSIILSSSSSSSFFVTVFFALIIRGGKRGQFERQEKKRRPTSFTRKISEK